MSEEPGEKKRSGRKVSFNAYLDAKAQIGASDQEMMDALGYGKNTWRHWLDEGEMPFVAGIACEALVRRKGIEPAKGGTTHVVLTLEDGEPRSFMRISKTRMINLDGREYWLVPMGTKNG